MNTNPEEAENYRLAVRARDGDNQALAVLITRLRGPLFAAAFAELRHYEDAQDAVADAVLRICRNIGNLREPAQARAWMLQIARNEARRYRSLPVTDLAEAESQTLSSPAPSLLRLDVENALRSLPADTASAIAQFYLDGQGVREIATNVGRPEGTVKYWLHRGRVHLHQQLKGYNPMETETDTAINLETQYAGNAAIISTELSPELTAQMTTEIQRAGWSNVRHIAEVPAFIRNADGSLPEPLSGCLLIVLDEFVGGRSAFELSTLWRSTQEGRQVAILLLIDGRNESVNRDDTIMAAYIAGFDMLLTKPFDAGEIESFTRRIRQVQMQAGKR
jgi:RNA polymerase sigma factor (sigma-70 family)